MQAKEALEKMNLPRDFRGPRKILQIWITRRCNLACFNCLAIDTRFITRNGVRSFKDFKDGDSTTVLTHAGNWKHAIVRNYGKKKVYPITFVRGKTKITVKATADHRWLLLNGDVVEGVEHGDRLIKAPMPAAKWNYDNVDPGESHNSHFTVNNIGNTGKTQSVWCLEVEDDHSFVLPSGLVTGNCTQGSNYRGSYQDMTPDQFRTACLSLKDYPGVTALFGGNPCIHKQFEDICAIARELIPWNRRGIWTNALLGKGKVCRETFNPNMSNFNVHLDKKAEEEFKRDWPEAIHLKSNTHDSRHAPVFISMKDLDKLRFPDGSIKDNTEENRWELITTCDINKHWSAMVGVFRGQLRGWFCEIAGAQSILKQDNPSYPDTGLEISPGWWRKGLEAFAPQIIQHCHNCGVPLRGHGALAVEGDKDGSAEQCSETYINVCQPKKSGRPVHLVEHIEDLGKKVPHVTDYLANYKL